MADMLKITAISSPKNYALSAKPIAQSDTVFDLADLTKIAKANDRTTEFRQNDESFTGNNASTLLDIQLKIAKNPTFSSNLLRELVSDDILTQVANSGSPDIIKEFNQFVKNIFLTSDSVSGDLLLQGQGATAFSSEFFDILRNIMNQTSSAEVKNTIAALLKNAFTLQSQDEILKSISANFKFLSESFAPSKSISTQLGNLSELFSSKDAAANFPELKDAALKLLDMASNSLIATDKLKNMISLMKYNISRFNDNPRKLIESFNSLLSMTDNEELKSSLTSAFEKYVQGSSMTQLSKDAILAGSDSFLSTDKLTFKLAELADKHTSIIDTASLKSDIELIADKLIKNLPLQSGGAIPLEQGSKALEELLKAALPSNAGQDAAEFIKVFQETKDLNTLITRLSYMLNAMGNSEVKNLLAEKMNFILTGLSNSGDISYKPPSSMENLVDFISKAINNQNIPLLGIVDPNTLVHSMLTAPGVFTPLLHYILPVQIEDLRAFGELWVDNGSENEDPKSEEDTNHLFLRFDVEKVGTFEMEIYSKDTSLDVSLFCPKDMVKSLSSIKNSIDAVAEASGYKVKSASFSPLNKIRNLVEIFPKIAERRTGLDAKI